MKKKLLLSLAALLCTACAGEGTSSAGLDCPFVFDHQENTFSTCVAENWGIMDSETMELRGLPPEEVDVVFIADQPSQGEFPTVIVTKELLKEDISPAAYSTESIRLLTLQQGYREVSKESVTIDGAAVTLHTFVAKPLTKEPAMKFYQLSTVHDGVGYTFMGRGPETIASSTEEEILTVLKNVSFRDNNEQEEEEG